MMIVMIVLELLLMSMSVTSISSLGYVRSREMRGKADDSMYEYFDSVDEAIIGKKNVVGFNLGNTRPDRS